MEGFPAAEDLAFCTDATIERSLERIERAARDGGVRLERCEIGRSRAGRALWGLRMGSGARSVSVTAGAHADEPVGPMTAMALGHWLAQSQTGAALLSDHTFHICPQVNPDGAEANRPWFSDPLDPIAYLTHAIRERPGEDVEFGYPDPTGRSANPIARGGALRPENEAVAGFLRGGAPYVYHASLHGMGFCEGAWFLIGADWAERSGPLRDALARRRGELGFGFHDIDREGKKGFTRIAQGFSTTPNSLAMRDFFLGEDDPATADLFHLSSMEFIQGLGGDPLVMVSELPLFTIGVDYEWSDPPGDDTPFMRLRARLPEARRDLLAGSPDALSALLREFEIIPTPLRAQVRLQGLMIVEALKFLDSKR